MKGTVWLPANLTIYGPWFPRRGDNLDVTAEVVDNVGGVTFQIKVFTKSFEEAGDGVDAGSTANRRIFFNGTTGRLAAEWDVSTGPGLEDLVRYQFTTGEGFAGDGVEFRMLPPVWFNTSVSGLSHAFPS